LYRNGGEKDQGKKGKELAGGFLHMLLTRERKKKSEKKKDLAL